MRSQMPSSSGISDEITRMPLPSSASRLMMRVDLVLGADVDAARRLVEDQHLGVGEQPLRQHHLLLVAAGQVADRLVDAGRADVGALAVVVGDLELAHVVDDAALRHALEVGDRDVVLDVVDEVEAEGLAVLGDVGEPVRDRPLAPSRCRPACRAGAPRRRCAGPRSGRTRSSRTRCGRRPSARRCRRPRPCGPRGRRP